MTRLLAVPAHRRTVLRGVVLGGIIGRLAAPAPVSASEQETGTCTADQSLTGPFAVSGNPRYAETFIAAVGGQLSGLVFVVDKAAGSTGDFVVKLHAVDPETGIPTSKVLVSKRVANSSVPEGELSRGVALFKKRKTIKLVQGKPYAVVLSRPNGSGDGAGFAVRVTSGDLCADNSFFVSHEQSGVFAPADSHVDMIFGAYVGYIQ
jgi:hypothetical protein